MKVEWTGIRPLLFANPQTVNITNPYAVASRKLNSDLKKARKKEDEGMLAQIAEKQRLNDFLASAYWDDGESCFYLPDTVIIACLKAGAQTLKKGKDIDRAVVMEETHAVITTKATFRTLEEAFANREFRMESWARVPPKTGAAVWKTRAMVPTGWRLSFTLAFDPDMIADSTLREALAVSGRSVGVGAWRPTFGRFTVKISG